MTSARPPLPFGPPTAGQIPTGTPRFPGSTAGPGPTRQRERLEPQFTALQGALQSGRVDVTAETAEADPELVVVFDLAGTVAEFARAAGEVPGLEFLLEVDGEEFEPDDDFYLVRSNKRSADPVTDSLYVVMSNADAVAQLLSLFAQWQRDPRGPLPRGLAPLRRVFALLREVRRWGPQDRVRETGLLEDWRETVEIVGQSTSFARVEIELWYRRDSARRAVAQAEVAGVVAEAGGQVISQVTIEGIDYHAMLVDIPYQQVESVVQQGPDAIELLRTDTIMYVLPARPMSILGVAATDEPLDPARFATPPSGKPPRVALLDGLPMAGHLALNGRLIIDDPDQIAVDYSSSQMHHGTAMASLICHGDLNEDAAPSSRRLYVRPIMRPHPLFDESEIVIPDRLMVDLIHRAFRRMFEADGSASPQVPSVRVVNLSVGDPAQMFIRRISPVAKLLDWLAHRYNLVILVSAGNHDIDVTVPAATLSDTEALRQSVATAMHERARLRRILSPAEAINVVTVGALHFDAATTPVSDTVLDTVRAGMPALYTPVGFGHHNSAKPEVMLPGGRSLHQRPPSVEGDTALYAAETTVTGPGLRVAAPGTGGAITSSAYTHGTSNATALATRTVDGIFDVLEGLSLQPSEPPFPAAEYHPVLAKSLLVHAASWGSLRSDVEEAITDTSLNRRAVSRLLGYGAIDDERVATATSNRVLLLGAGSISANQRLTFALPLPGSLAATTEWRRLTVTLGWISEVNPRTRKHRMARLSFDPPGGPLAVEGTQAEYWVARAGTVQHEVFEGRRAVAFAVGDALQIGVDCRVDAGRLSSPVRFGLAATLEIGAAVQSDIHTEVRQQLQIRLQNRARQAATPRG
ncbi:S8 family peptidase [Mycobacterium paraterrae]|uniref:S8 family peptidase n=1 Tax=Mycobacterium paraterrae TaxID=577492 RepID=A0ABY3VS54_9MYCO|nr:S8 family peptidase [Mycobacterium paraterrae]UMB70023.1 S8 family peptidase [Mycobacterium paraterrae]